MILSWFLALLSLLHPVHISVTEAEYSVKDKTLQFTSRIFIDDLETSIRNARKSPELDLLKPGAGLTTDKLVSEYLQRHIGLRLDGKPVVLNYLAHEIEDVAIICYLESAPFRKAATIEVTNTVIQETHSDQSNIVHITFNGPVQSARLTQDEPSHVFNISTKR